MDTQPLSGSQQLLSHVISDMAQAVSQRHDEPQSRQLARAQQAAQTILAFVPADAIEAMIAGHCVMFHEMIVDSIQTTLRGELDATRRATRSGIVAMDKAFGANLLRLEQSRARNAEDTALADDRAETEIADRVRRHQAQPASVAADGDGPSVDAMDPCPATPDARTSATVAQMPGLNRQARRALSRRFRKCIDPDAAPIGNPGFGRP